MKSLLHRLSALIFGLSLALPVSGRVINIDFSRDISGANPGTNPADVLATSAGIDPDTGTIWNDFSVVMGGTTSSITAGDSRTNLVDSVGTPTDIDVALTSGFYRAFNPSTTSTYNSITREWIFSQDGVAATITVSGLVADASYDFYLIVGGNFGTTFTINGVAESASLTAGTPLIADWVEGRDYVKMTGTANSSGSLDIVLTDNNTSTAGGGAISGMQIVDSTTSGPTVNFFYATSAASTGGELSSSYSTANLMNAGFTSPADTINATGTPAYATSGNNYLSATGTTEGFNLTFEFGGSATVDGMHFWNYVYQNSSGGGETSPESGVNAYTLTFYNGSNGTGSQIGSVFSGNLAPAVFGAQNPAQSVYFAAAYEGVRSVVMNVVSNHGSTQYTGMAELAFNGSVAPLSETIISFTSSAPFVQQPAVPTLSWEVVGPITSLEISNSTEGTTDVTSLTSVNGLGSLEVSPLGDQTYTLTLNGTVQQSLNVVGLPTKEKLHIYLLMGQSNMQGTSGAVSASNPVHAPVPRIVKFGSRVGMEQQFVTGGHPLPI